MTATSDSLARIADALEQIAEHGQRREIRMSEIHISGNDIVDPDKLLKVAKDREWDAVTMAGLTRPLGEEAETAFVTHQEVDESWRRFWAKVNDGISEFREKERIRLHRNDQDEDQLGESVNPGVVVGEGVHVSEAVNEDIPLDADSVDANDQVVDLGHESSPNAGSGTSTVGEGDTAPSPDARGGVR